MGLPRAVKDAEDQANGLIQGAQNDPTPTPGNTGENEPPTPEPMPPEVGTPAPDSDWEAKYKVLQGKYNAEVPRLREQMDALKNTVNQPPANDPQMQQQLSELQTQNQQLQQQLAEAQKEPAKLNEYLVSEYGEDFAGAVAAQAESLAERQTNALKAELDALRQQVGQVQETSQQASSDMRVTTLKSKLSSLNIDFDQTDQDPLFHEWLQQTDPFSGYPRQSLLQQAFANGDIDRTASFYTAYKTQERSSLDSSPFAKHVDPAGRNNAPDGGTEADIWTSAQVDAFYDAYNKGQLSQEEYEKQEQSLFRALQAGNVN